MKTYTLPTGESVIVDDADYDLIAPYKWHRVIEPSGLIYAVATITKADGKRTSVSVHRVLTGAIGQERVDHRDGDGLNNRRDNLRVGTDRDNLRGFQRKRLGCTSRFRGVHWDPVAKKWRACVSAREGNKLRHFHAGRHDSEVAAAIAYNERATEQGFSAEALNKVA